MSGLFSTIENFYNDSNLTENLYNPTKEGFSSDMEETFKNQKNNNNQLMKKLNEINDKITAIHDVVVNNENTENDMNNNTEMTTENTEPETTETETTNEMTNENETTNEMNENETTNEMTENETTNEMNENETTNEMTNENEGFTNFGNDIHISNRLSLFLKSLLIIVLFVLFKQFCFTALLQKLLKPLTRNKFIVDLLFYTIVYGILLIVLFI